MPRRSPCYLVLLPILLWPLSQCFCGLNRLQLAVKTRKRSFLLQVAAKRSKDDQWDMVPVPPYFYAVKLDPDNYGQMAAYFADTYERNPEALAEAFRDRGKKAGIREVRSIRAESMQTSFFDMGSRAKQPYVFALGVDGTGSSAQIKKLLAEAISEFCNKAGTTPKSIQAGSIRTDLFQLKPTARLAYIFKQGDDVIEMIADYLAVTVETLPANLANAINGSCNKAKITVKRIETAGSVRTKTAAWSSSDLDLNIYSAENVTPEQRSLFKDELNARLLNEKHGWSVHRLGKKCLQLKGPRHEHVDIAFVNTTFNWGFIDRRANVEFFASHKSAQRAVRMFKYVFQNAQGLCGVHIENLARDVFRTRA